MSRDPHVQRAAMKLLKRQRPVSPRAVAEAAGCALPTARQALYRLRDLGLAELRVKRVARSGPGWVSETRELYAKTTMPPDQGRAALVCLRPGLPEIGFWPSVELARASLDQQPCCSAGCWGRHFVIHRVAGHLRAIPADTDWPTRPTTRYERAVKEYR